MNGVAAGGGWTVGLLAGAYLAWRWRHPLVAIGLVLAAAVSGGLIPVLAAGGGAAGGPLAAGAPVPAAYRPWVERAGSFCPQISPALIAAQLSQESGFNPNARGSSGEQGIAQFMPRTWPSWATDANHNGPPSPLDPPDAIEAQGHFMCHLAGAASAGVSTGRLHGNVTALALAGYNAGFGAVQAAGGLPAIPSTRAYVTHITNLADRYADPSRL
ncbi:lytic transglycosylase domain-containing protein [Pseudofrankia inefficax]|uniref:Lytic transglycosylase catalytic n=1 Tax=Pseudofrankia inefficax (strain DSM 45817 / CECT 9037 / DDB 130130 / EuI1c) TaxID=298654 RepID=E3IX37_PSEI1|nr:lytic transglycosylase domain-containing protein [Pseudofrankia inefficax]ADP83809.1 Lytic transglycosylase catalytic [Pseudofrankia inefficax]